MSRKWHRPFTKGKCASPLSRVTQQQSTWENRKASCGLVSNCQEKQYCYTLRLSRMDGFIVLAVWADGKRDFLLTSLYFRSKISRHWKHTWNSGLISGVIATADVMSPLIAIIMQTSQSITLSHGNCVTRELKELENQENHENYTITKSYDMCCAVEAW